MGQWGLKQIVCLTQIIPLHSDNAYSLCLVIKLHIKYFYTGEFPLCEIRWLNNCTSDSSHNRERCVNETVITFNTLKMDFRCYFFAHRISRTSAIETQKAIRVTFREILRFCMRGFKGYIITKYRNSMKFILMYI